jgi:hypothetical protein
MPGIFGPGGGRVGALVISPFVTPGTTSDTPYNHYSLLRTVEDLFGLAHLGYAGANGLAPFGSDVFDAPVGVRSASSTSPPPPGPASPSPSAAPAASSTPGESLPVTGGASPALAVVAALLLALGLVSRRVAR